jgi:hypothetical protein
MAEALVMGDKQQLELFTDLHKMHALADAWAQKLAPKLPDGQRMLHLYRPMHFAVRKLGKARIESEVAQKFEVVNMRNAFLLGLPRLTVDFGQPVEFNRLYVGKNMLTSDKPVEIHQQYISFSKARGHVLIGGLGLGMCAEMMRRMPAVKTITVVERNQDVIDLIAPQLTPGIHIVKGDVRQFLQTTALRFDFAYHDIWYSCGERDWAASVVPLYRLSRKAGIQSLGAWGEFEMQAQLRSALFMRAMGEKKWSTWKPYKVFIEGCIRKFMQEPPFPESLLPEISKMVKLYLTQVGTPRWEATFDWDEKRGEAHVRQLEGGRDGD